MLLEKVCAAAGMPIYHLLLQPRVWIFEVVFANSGAPFKLIFVHAGAFGQQPRVPDDLTPLPGSHESSGAHLGPYF